METEADLMDDVAGGTSSSSGNNPPASVKSFTCSICNRAFTMRRLYERHLQMHANGLATSASSDFYTWGETNLIGIPGTNSNEPTLLFQESDTNDLSEFRCFMCHRVFSSIKGMKAHMTRMHTGGERDVDQDETMHVNGSESTSPMIVCDLCGCYFENREGLIAHLVEIHGTTIVKPEPVTDIQSPGSHRQPADQQQRQQEGSQSNRQRFTSSDPNGSSNGFVDNYAEARPANIDLDAGGQYYEHQCCICERDFVSARALSVHLSRAHCTGNGQRNDFVDGADDRGEGFMIPLPNVGNDNQMDIDEEDGNPKPTNKSPYAIKEEYLQNVKTESVDIGGSLPILRPGDKAGLVISNVFSLNASPACISEDVVDGGAVMPTSSSSSTQPKQQIYVTPVGVSASNSAPSGSIQRRRSRTSDAADYVHLCRFCGKAYAHPSNKFRHQRVCSLRHTGGKNIVDASDGVTVVDIDTNINTNDGKSSSSYDCHVCGSRFTNRVGLSVHVRKMHNGEMEDESDPNARHFYCCDCGLRYALMTNLICHRKRNCTFRDDPAETAGIWRCYTCGEPFPSVNGYLQHGLDNPTHCRIHHQQRKQQQLQQKQQATIEVVQKPLPVKGHTNAAPDKPWPCRLCRKFFSTKPELNHHRQVQHGLGSYVLNAPGNWHCSICRRQFRYKHHMIRHQRSAHDEYVEDESESADIGQPEPFQQIQSQQSMINVDTTPQTHTAMIITTPSPTTTIIKGLSCEDCGIAFSTRRLLIRHMERVHKMTESMVIQQQQQQQELNQMHQQQQELNAISQIDPDMLSAAVGANDENNGGSADINPVWINGKQTFLCNRTGCTRVFSSKNGLSVHLYRAHIRPTLEQQQPVQPGGPEEASADSGSPTASGQQTLPPLSSIFAPLSSVPSTALTSLAPTTIPQPQTATTTPVMSVVAQNTPASSTAATSASGAKIKILPRPANLTKAQVQSSWEACGVTVFPGPQPVWRDGASADTAEQSPIVQVSHLEEDDDEDEEEDEEEEEEEEAVVVKEKEKKKVDEPPPPTKDVESKVSMAPPKFKSTPEPVSSGRRSTAYRASHPECHLCGKRFRSQMGLKVHHSIMHSRDSKRFGDLGHSIDIENSTSNMVSFACSLCTREFTTAPGLKRHITRSHRGHKGAAAKGAILSKSRRSAIVAPVSIDDNVDLDDREEQHDKSAPAALLTSPVEHSSRNTSKIASSTPIPVSSGRRAAEQTSAANTSKKADNNSPYSRRHRTTTTQTFKCSVCRRNFVSMMGLKVHSTRMHGITPIIGGEEADENTTSSTGDEAEETEPVEEPIPETPPAKKNVEKAANVCIHCDKEFPTVFGLKVHLGRLHSAPGEIQRKSSSRYSAPTMVQPTPAISVSRTQVRATPVVKSSMSFTETSGDPDEDDWTCTLCHRSFRNRMGLSTHQRTHGSRAPSRVFGCERCLQRFTKWCNMVTHQKTCCPVKLGLFCPYCDERFDQGLDMYSHIAGVHAESESNVPCPKCSERFSSPTKVREHLSMTHVPSEEEQDETPKPEITIQKQSAVKKRKKQRSLGHRDAKPHNALFKSAVSNKILLPKPQSISSGLHTGPSSTSHKVKRMSVPVAVVAPTSVAGVPVDSMSADLKRIPCYDVIQTVDSKGEEVIQYSCKNCDRVYASQKAVEGHQSAHKNKRRQSAPVFAPISSGPPRKRHKHKHRQHQQHSLGAVTSDLLSDQQTGGAFPCKLCPKSFNSVQAVYAHQRVHSPARRHMCPDCGRGFVSKTSLAYHQSWYCSSNKADQPDDSTNIVDTDANGEADDTDAIPIPIDDKNKKPAIVKEENDDKNKMPDLLFGCSICGKMYRQESRMLEHKRTAHPNFIKPVKTPRGSAATTEANSEVSSNADVLEIPTETPVETMVTENVNSPEDTAPITIASANADPVAETQSSTQPDDVNGEKELDHVPMEEEIRLESEPTNIDCEPITLENPDEPMEAESEATDSVAV